jgi:2-polyprenyl-6-methoxyphenol hydroxylase-like FAD-dependent oxidoreductase
MGGIMIDVLITGAGPTALMLASLCRRLNLTYIILDKNSGPTTESRAIGIHSRSLELFHELGIVDDFLACGLKAAGVNVYVNGFNKIEVDISDMERSDTLYPFIFLLTQMRLKKKY